MENGTENGLEQVRIERPFNMPSPGATETYGLESTALTTVYEQFGDELEMLAAICLQGSGPHFCPGGNPNARRRAGETLLQVEPFSMFLAVLRLKELGGPIAVALQGLVLGGGLAMALLGDLRVIDANASVCFGNLSRGMVPCMLLSLHFAMALGEAMDLYLTDDVQSAATWQQVTGDCLVDGVQEAKAEAFRSLQRMPRSYLSHLTVGDNFQLRFAREAAALQLSLKCESSPLLRDGMPGTLFSFPEATKVESAAKKSAKELKMDLEKVEKASRGVLKEPSGTPEQGSRQSATVKTVRLRAREAMTAIFGPAIIGYDFTSNALDLVKLCRCCSEVVMKLSLDQS
eukprot:Skav206952  [mRNA]  locus=scaffold6419:44576:47632:- [translate_table: standard]